MKSSRILAIKSSQILTPAEVRQIVTGWQQRRPSSDNYGVCLAVFRLSCCLGLRSCEIAGLNLADLVCVGPSPALQIRAEITKAHNGKRRGRELPLDVLDTGMLQDITRWHERRMEQTGGDSYQPLVCRQSAGSRGRRFIPKEVQKRWKTAIRCLGVARVSQISCHSGRHTFASFCLAQGVQPQLVRDWLGHSSLDVTSIYAHAVHQLQGHRLELFRYDP
jgi:integrase